MLHRVSYKLIHWSQLCFFLDVLCRLILRRRLCSVCIALTERISLPLKSLSHCKIFHRYQVFDSLQAFSSSIAGLLSSRAVLEGDDPRCDSPGYAIFWQERNENKGFGVGDEKASSTNAVLLTIFQDATGRLASESILSPLKGTLVLGLFFHS